jgi:hypothetical protein
MPESSRRRFLAITGASAVVIGAAAAAPGSLASAALARNGGANSEHAADAMLDAQPMIVCVDDLNSGQISVMHGDREFATTDADLARRIAQLAGLGA